MKAILTRWAPLYRSLPPAAAMLLILASCGSNPVPEQTATPASAAPVDVRAVKVIASTSGYLTVPGNVEAARSVSIASRIPGIIERLAVEEGARVRKSDLLVRLDGQELTTQVEAADAAVAAARAHFERIKALHEKEAATRQELEEALARSLSAEAAAAGARARLGYIELRAPFDGVIVAKKAAAGDLAAPGVAILTLEGADRMRVAATVTQSQSQRLAIGQSIDALLEDGPTHPCVVSILSPGGDAGSGRFLVKCDLLDVTTARSGSFARLRVADETTEASIMAPRAALIERGGLTGLFVIEDGKARLRYISPGAAVGDSMVVRAGLAPGDEVVLSPGTLTEGAPVRATLAEPVR